MSLRSTGRQTFYNVTSAIAVAVLLHPLDVIKTLRMSQSPRGGQKSNAPTSRTTKSRSSSDKWAIESVWKLARSEGIGRLYTGVGLTIMSVGVNWGIYRSIYESLGRNRVFRSSVRVGRTAVASTIASASTILLSYPFYSMKTEMVVRGVRGSSRERVARWIESARSGNSKELMRQYRGLLSMLCTVPTGVLQMVLYEQLKKALAITETRNPWGNTGRRLLWSAGSKVSATWLTYPFHVIRFHQQFPELLCGDDESSNEKRTLSSLETAQLLVRYQGLPALYKGFWHHTQKSLIQNVLTLLIFEAMAAKSQSGERLSTSK